MVKFNANNLSYDQKLPPFLAALRGQVGSNDGSPGPILAGRRRAAKPRSASEEAENAPVVLDDHGNVVGGVTFGRDGGVVARAAEEETADTDLRDGGGSDGPNNSDTLKEALVGVGAGKKRRAGKVIGGGSSTRGDDEGRADHRKRRRFESGEVIIEDKDGEETRDTKSSEEADRHHGKDKKTGSRGPAKERNRKPAKKIKLSFENDEDEDEG